MDDKKPDDMADDMGSPAGGGSGEGNGSKDDPGYLLTYTRHIERRNRALEAEKQLLDAERSRLERELHSLRNELDRIRQPPLLVAKMKRLLPDGRAIVNDGIRDYLVNRSLKLQGQIKPGQYVALNQRTFAVVEVVPEPDEPRPM
ncbi:MAG: hypothetical protein JW839_16320 [Candidatus Lokiarchaeota archaeon]|nr:hypothetical protein [Candidatus Lokiarchaeota archaeon]